ncbi:recombinase family protein [Flavobacterium sp.]|uniref:recombinase family protein n=1 Tax=Flavobacterium sp. TaxID=239 RepID=UPI00333F628E
MKVLYVRTSTTEQKTDRQRVNEKDYHLVIEDKCSGSTDLFEREGGRKLLKLIEKGVLSDLYIWEIDRLGRNLLCILNNIKFFNEKNICIHFVSQGLSTLQPDGSENNITKMIISILGTLAEMEKKISRERQLEGIAIAKLNKKYTGRAKGSNEDVLKFLSKPKNSKAVEYIKKGYKNIEVAKIVGVHINTITKIRKIANLIK